MKRNILSILLVCVLLVSVCVLSGCKDEELIGRVDGLEQEVDANATADEAAAKKAADELAAAKDALTTLIGTKADKTALEAAVADYVAKYDAVKAIADAAATSASVTELKAALEAADTAIKKSVTDLSSSLTTLIGTKADKTALDAAITDYKAKYDAVKKVADAAATAASVKTLNETLAAADAAIKKSVDDLSAKVAKDTADLQTALDAANTNITALQTAKTALEESLAALQTTVKGLGTGTEEAIDAITEAIAAIQTSYIKIDNWANATPDVVKAYFEIEDSFWNSEFDFHYDEQLDQIYEILCIKQIEILRATTQKEVADLVAAYYAAVKAIGTKADYIYAVLTELGKTADDVLLNEAWNKVITKAEALIAAETEAEVIETLADVTKLATEMRTRYTLLEGKKVEADALNVRIEALIALIKTNAYDAANKAEYEDLIADIAAWDAIVGDKEANLALVNREALETLKKDYAAALDAYKAAAQAILDKLAVYNADTYVYICTEENFAAIEATLDAIEAWAKSLDDLGFDDSILEGEIEKPVVDAIKAFAMGAYSRAINLEDANAEATGIEADIKALLDDLTSMTIIKSEYQTRLADITEQVEIWKSIYFSAPYADVTGTQAANYALLDHAAFETVTKLYNDKVAVVLELAEALKAALAKIDVITVCSGADIEAASVAYTKFTDKLSDLGYAIDGLGDAKQITDTLVKKLLEFDAISATAVSDYKAITVLNKTTVTIYDQAAVEAIIDWYNTYFKVDATKADSVLPVKTITLTAGSESLTITEEAFASVIELNAAFNTLKTAKLAELEALIKDIKALNDADRTTAQRAALDLALAARKAYREGTNAPEGFKAAQFAIDDLKLGYEITNTADLDTVLAAVEALEVERDALIERIEALADTTVDALAVLATRETYTTTIATLKADITAFTTKNKGVDCFADYADEIATAELNIVKGAKIAVANEKIDVLAGLVISDAEVSANVAAKAEAFYKAAVDAIKAATSAEAVNADSALAIANIDLITYVVEQYNAALSRGVLADAARATYKLWDAREDMKLATQLDDEKVFVKDLFAAIEAPELV